MKIHAQLFGGDGTLVHEGDLETPAGAPEVVIHAGRTFLHQADFGIDAEQRQVISFREARGVATIA